MTELRHPLTGRLIRVPDPRAAEWLAAGWLPGHQDTAEHPPDGDEPTENDDEKEAN